VNISAFSFVAGALFVLLGFICIFLLGAAKTAHRDMAQAQDDRLRLAEANKALAMELQRKPQMIITDEQVFKLATMVNNMRAEISNSGGVPKAWKN